VAQLPVGDFQVNTYFLNLAVGVPKQVLLANPFRWSLIFDTNDTTAGHFIEMQPVAQTAGQVGIIITMGQGRWEANFRDHGALVSQAWFALSSTVSAISAIEVLLLPYSQTQPTDLPERTANP
jgi:hypothetical protein